jgi:hypothetical protein
MSVFLVCVICSVLAIAWALLMHWLDDQFGVIGIPVIVFSVPTALLMLIFIWLIYFIAR